MNIRHKLAILSGMLSFLLAVILSVPARAADTKTYIIDEVGMSVQLPASCTTLTRTTELGDPAFVQRGIDAKAFRDYCIENSVYLNSEALDKTYEITVQIKSSSNSASIGDFNRYSENDLASELDSIQKSLENTGTTEVDTKVYSQAQTNFILIHGVIPSEHRQIYRVAYFTIVGGKTVFLLHPNIHTVHQAH